MGKIVKVTGKFAKDHAPELVEEVKGEVAEAKTKFDRNWDQWKPEDLKKLGNREMREITRELRGSFLGGLAKKFFESKNRWELIERFNELAIKERKKDLSRIKEKFQQKLSDLMSEIPLSKEEQERYLSLEAVTNMDLDSFLLLMKRLSGKYFSHVTRFGVRENVFKGDGGHSEGEGGKSELFLEILNNRRLIPFFTSLLTNEDYAEEMLHPWIEKWLTENPDATRQAVIDEAVDSLMKSETNLMPADLSSVHVAEGAILPRLYGTEVNYDIFIYYPAEIIGHNFAWNQKSPYSAGTEDKHNDATIWNTNEGVPIDAGIVCIPKHVRVDPETGSKYILDEENKPTVQPKIATHIEFYEANRDLFRDTIRQLDTHENSGRMGLEQDPKFQEAAKLLHFESTYQFIEFFRERNQNTTLQRFYQFKMNDYFEKPERKDTITSQEYWENYFRQNPAAKPSKVLFYDEVDLFDLKKGVDSRFRDEKKVKHYQETVRSKVQHISETPEYETHIQQTKTELTQIVGRVYDNMKYDQAA